MFTHKYLLDFWPFCSLLMIALSVLLLIDLILRAVSLWRAARAHQLAWFIALLVFNTASVLPIIYLLFFSGEALFKGRQKQIAKRSASKRKKR